MSQFSLNRVVTMYTKTLISVPNILSNDTPIRTGRIVLITVHDLKIHMHPLISIFPLDSINMLSSAFLCYQDIMSFIFFTFSCRARTDEHLFALFIPKCPTIIIDKILRKTVIIIFIEFNDASISFACSFFSLLMIFFPPKTFYYLKYFFTTSVWLYA